MTKWLILEYGAFGEYPKKVRKLFQLDKIVEIFSKDDSCHIQTIRYTSELRGFEYDKIEKAILKLQEPDVFTVRLDNDKGLRFINGEEENIWEKKSKEEENMFRSGLKAFGF